MFDTEILEFHPPSFDELDLTAEEWSLIDLPPEAGWATIPPRLDEMEPGPHLAAILSTIDSTRVSGHDRVTVLRARRRLVSHAEALAYRDISLIVDYMESLGDDPETARDAASFEIRAALVMTRRAADCEIDLAEDLRRRIPSIARLLESGAVDVRRARAVADSTAHLPPDEARKVSERVSTEAPRKTTGQLRSMIRHLSLTIDPDAANKRYEEAHEERRLVLDAGVWGTASLMLSDVAPDVASRVFSNVDRIARGLKVGGEGRSIDQLRADVAVELLGGGQTGLVGSRGTIDICVDLTTLAGLDEHPGDLAGYGPVIADIARQVAGRGTSSEWRYTVTDPETGAVVRNGTTRRRPLTSQRREVLSRQRTCVCPGCRAPATRSDLDHTRPYSHTGRTITSELAPLCRADHTRRHAYNWTYVALDDGDFLWTTRLGHNYTTSGRSPP